MNALTPTEAAARYIEILDGEGSKAAVAAYGQITAGFSAKQLDEMEGEFIRLGRIANDKHREQFHCTAHIRNAA